MEPELRDWYLSTLGVVQYRLRCSSPVQAQPGAEQVNVQSDGGALSTQTLPQRGDGHDSVPTSLRDLFEPLEGKQHGKQGSEEANASPAAQPPGNKLVEETTSFRLACWRPSEDLLVIDSWPVGRDSDNRLTQLLSNILKSVQRKPDTLMQAEFIDWPMGDDRSLSAAQDHLAMFVQGRYEQQSFSWVLAMGQQARNCFARVEQVAESVSGAQLKLQSEHQSAPGSDPDAELSRLLLDCGAEVVFTHSLSEMIETPECKKDVWAKIRFLSS